MRQVFRSTPLRRIRILATPLCESVALTFTVSLVLNVAPAAGLLKTAVGGVISASGVGLASGVAVGRGVAVLVGTGVEVAAGVAVGCGVAV